MKSTFVQYRITAIMCLALMLGFAFLHAQPRNLKTEVLELTD